MTSPSDWPPPATDPHERRAEARVPTPGLHLDGSGTWGVTLKDVSRRAEEGRAAQEMMVLRIPLGDLAGPFYIYGTWRQLREFTTELVQVVELGLFGDLEKREEGTPETRR